MFTVLLPQGVNPTADNKYININLNKPSAPACHWWDRRGEKKKSLIFLVCEK
jgi:hypothetical protein